MSDACFKKIPKKRITLSPTGSLFLTDMILSRHLTISALNSSSSKSSCSSWPFFPPFLPVSGGSKQHASWIFLKLTTNFLCVAVVFCASLNTWAIWVRRVVTGPSSGISTAFADCLAEDPRVALVVPPLALRAVVVVDPRGARVEGRPGIVGVWSAVCVVVYCGTVIGINCRWCCCLRTPPRGNGSWEQGSRVQGPPLTACDIGRERVDSPTSRWHHLVLELDLCPRLCEAALQLQKCSGQLREASRPLHVAALRSLAQQKPSRLPSISQRLRALVSGVSLMVTYFLPKLKSEDILTCILSNWQDTSYPSQEAL